MIKLAIRISAVLCLMLLMSCSINKVSDKVGPAIKSLQETSEVSPKDSSVAGDTYNGPHTHNNAVGVNHQGVLWVFYSTQDPDNNINYRRKHLDGTWSDGHSVEVNGSKQHTKAMLCPLVVRDTLYLFWTGSGKGTLSYAYLDPVTEEWKGVNSVCDDKTDKDARYAAVYNISKNRIEVYYVKDDTSDFYYIYYDIDNGKWSEKTKFASLDGAKKNLSAVFYQTGENSYVTYLTFYQSSYA
jgi:hypothetical protein